MAAEQSVDTRFDWTACPEYQTPEFHRIRFIRIFTMYVKPEEDIAVMAFQGVACTQGQHGDMEARWHDFVKKDAALYRQDLRMPSLAGRSVSRSHVIEDGQEDNDDENRNYGHDDLENEEYLELEHGHRENHAHKLTAQTSLTSTYDAKLTMKLHASRHGFDTRVGHSFLSTKPPAAIIVCTLEGTHKPEKYDDPTKRRPKAGSDRLGCPYRIYTSSPAKLKGDWHITKTECVHNHPLKEVDLSPSLTIEAQSTHLGSTQEWTKTDEGNHLKAVFWMSPDQVALFRRYHDILVHDIMAGTNRFGMSLHCFVDYINSPSDINQLLEDFDVMSYGSFKYHPRLILKRWFKDELQDAHNSEERIMSEPFVITYPIIEERATSKIVLIPRT
ncbi:hypothetical protein B0O80DRAFT_504578 [Mortierella sp. GBAus27b]|nr:hypothetical protein B0O80DRAFT_504578 [Mortierella sp. GBAus27b]